jgi:hypothetical protein
MILEQRGDRRLCLGSVHQPIVRAPEVPAGRPASSGEFSAPAGGIPQSRQPLRPQSANRHQRFQQPCLDQDWRASCPYLGERSVFRAAVLSIVLTLAIGPHASLLCSVWCHPDEVKTSACQHQDSTTSPRMTGEDSCQTAPASPTAFVREDAKRGSPTPISQQAVAIPPFRLGPPPTHTLGAYEAAAALGAVASPLLIPLRL